MCNISIKKFKKKCMIYMASMGPSSEHGPRHIIIWLSHQIGKSYKRLGCHGMEIRELSYMPGEARENFTESRNIWPVLWSVIIEGFPKSKREADFHGESLFAANFVDSLKEWSDHPLSLPFYFRLTAERSAISRVVEPNCKNPKASSLFWARKQATSTSFLSSG